MNKNKSMSCFCKGKYLTTHFIEGVHILLPYGQYNYSVTISITQ